MEYQCKFCDNAYDSKRSKGQHQIRCQMNPDKIQPAGAASKGYLIGRSRTSGFTGKSHSTLSKGKLSFSLTGKVHSNETRNKIAFSMIGKGGLRQGSGRGKKGWYKGFFCDSSWELAYIIYCLDHKIKIKRNFEYRIYEWEGKQRRYVPDFLVNDKLVEIKGFDSPQWRAKHHSNPDVKVLFESDLEEIFSYVIDKYGKDYVNLYDKNLRK